MSFHLVDSSSPRWQAARGYFSSGAVGVATACIAASMMLDMGYARIRPSLPNAARGYVYRLSYKGLVYYASAADSAAVPLAMLCGFAAFILAAALQPLEYAVVPAPLPTKERPVRIVARPRRSSPRHKVVTLLAFAATIGIIVLFGESLAGFAAAWGLRAPQRCD